MMTYPFARREKIVVIHDYALMWFLMLDAVPSIPQKLTKPCAFFRESTFAGRAIPFLN